MSYFILVTSLVKAIPSNRSYFSSLSILLSFILNPLVLGIEFMDQVKVVPIPFVNSLCILEEGNTHLVQLERETRLQEKQISAMQLAKRVKKMEPTYLVALKEETVAPPTKNLPKGVEHVLEEFQDMMSPELPKRLPPKREMDHKIEMVPGATPTVAVSYRMAPPKLEELRRQLKELMDMGYIRPSKVPYGALV